jgi:hypothetical protein
MLRQLPSSGGAHTRPSLPPLEGRRLEGRHRIGRLWPAVALAALAALLAYLLATDPSPQLTHRSLVILGLAVVVLAVLTIRCTAGPLALVRTLAEYAAVALLAALLVTVNGAPPPTSPAARQARAEQAAVLPPVVREVVGGMGWLVDLWERAGREVRERRGGA